MLKWWLENWEKLIAVIGFVVGVIGLYIGSKSWKRKKPTYLIRSNNLFSGLSHTVPDVEVRFSGYGQPIKSLTVTKIALWNAGSETIKKSDIVKTDPLTIRAKEGVLFLSAAVIESVNALNRLECVVSKERTEVTVTFDYLDHNQGSIIQVFHTGTCDADITLHGTVMGASAMKRRRASSSPRAERVPAWVVFVVLCVAWIGWGLLKSGIVSSPPPKSATLPREPFVIPLNVLGVVLIGVSILVVFVLYFFSIPKQLSKIYRD